MSSTRSRTGPSLRTLGAAEVIWGGVLLDRGERLFRGLERRAPDGVERAALLALGGRHVAQGVLEVAVPHRFAALYTGVDAIHAASMLLVAVFQPERRRAAAASAALAGLAGWRAWRCR